VGPSAESGLNIRNAPAVVKWRRGRHLSSDHRLRIGQMCSVSSVLHNSTGHRRLRIMLGRPAINPDARKHAGNGSKHEQV
jgi:hypothetical protein